MEWASDERFSTYEQYKEDTEAIAGWLAYNSRRCGYVLDGPVSAGPSNAPSARLKGKARKQARSVGAKSASTPTPLKPQYAINVSDFSRMAKAIADFKPKVVIPTALDNLFSRAIDARRRFTDWYKHSSHGEEKSNERHAHFTGVLNSAWEILRPFEPARKSHVKKQPANVPNTESLTNLANRFSKLEVEQSEDILDTETSTSAEQDDYKLTDIAPVTIVKSEEGIEEDFFFAIFAFMQELDELRAYIRHMWLGYSKGIMELMACSLLTNTAIQLVRRAEQELDFMEDMSSRGQDLDSFLKPSPRFFVLDCSHADLCLMETFGALKHSLYRFKAQGGQYLLAGNVGHQKGTPETLARITDMLPCFQGVARAMADSFTGDEITSGIGVMFDSQVIPIWVAFAVQALLDIQDELKAIPKKATPEVKQHARKKLAAFRSMDLSHEPFSKAEQGTQWLAATLGAYELDVLGDNFRKTLIGANVMRDANGRTMPLSRNLDAIRGQPGTHEFMFEPDYFLRINPVKCGMLKYGLYLQSHNHAVQFEASGRNITPMVHLYVACRTVFPDDPVWPDMEYFLGHQDLDYLFVGGLPGSMDEAYKKTLLSVGMSAANFAPNRRSTAPNIDVNKGRWVSSPCMLDDVFVTWMCGGSAGAGELLVNLVKVISDPKSATARARLTGMSPKAISISGDKIRTGADLRKVTILARLGAQVMAETHNLYFDWLSFVETCEKIWAQIYSALDQQNGKKRNRSKHSTLIDMLDEARKCEWMAEAAKVDAKSVVRENATGLVQSWQAIQKVTRQAANIPSESDSNANLGKKAWIGDKELFNVVSKAMGESAYPNLSMASLQNAYRNWSKEDFNQSRTVRTNCSRWPQREKQRLME
ncbi:hypothetical protein GGR52DRAFT_587363 [Hypoxylon sp. FL1284]|nr:hypothetical protein GGR52DRAFT_587363 [Hypoxylon sp. FL1284]